MRLSNPFKPSVTCSASRILSSFVPTIVLSLLSVGALLTLSRSASAQSAQTLFSDNFDSYSTTVTLAGQGGWIQDPTATAPLMLSASTPLGSSVAVDGLHRTGTGRYDNSSISRVRHRLSGPLDPNGISILSADVDAFNAYQSHASGIGLNSSDDATSLQAYASWYPSHSPAWALEHVGGATPSNDVVFGDFDERVHLEIVIDGVAGVAFMRLTAASGVLETPGTPITRQEIASLTDVVLQEDFRDVYLGVDLDNVLVTTGVSTIDFTDRAAFLTATHNLTAIGFEGILPPAENFGGYSQLDVPGASFSTPLSGTFVNVTKASFYVPNNYPADFIVDSVNQNTGTPNADNQLMISLTTPTLAVGLDLGGLGFSGASSGTITLSNGHVFNLSVLPTVGHTTFVGFISTIPITSITINTTNDSWVVEDLIIASPIVSSCTFSISPSGQAFNPQGGLGSFNLNTAAGCNWQLSYSSGWIVPISPFASPGGGLPSGSGPRTVTFSVAPNSGAARTGTISVDDQRFNIDQVGGSPPPTCTFAINPSHAVTDDLGGNLRIVVTAPAGCSWTATTNVGWLSLVSGASGQGTGAATLKVAINTGSARTGTVTIAGQTFAVSQGGGACGALDVTSETRALGGGYTYVPFTTYFYSGTITVTNTSAQTLHPPLYVVLVGLPNHLPYPAGDGVYGAAQTTCFTPTGDAMYLLPTGDLPPGSATAIAPLFFTQSLFGGISYQLRVLSGTPTH